MNKQFTFTLFILFFLCLFVYPYRASAYCDISNSSGSGIEQESIDNCLNRQRAQDQIVRNQQADAQALYESKLTYFYKLDAIEKQIETLNESDLNFDLYRFKSSDCYESLRINSDNPTALDPTYFISLVDKKAKCNDYLLKYTPKITQPTKTDDQMCVDKFGQNYKSVGSSLCGCKDGYIKTNGACLTYDQSCNISYPNSIFLKIDSSNGGKICDCKTGYVYNTTKTGCIIAPIKTGYQVCIDMNATWDGTSHTSSGGFSCSCNTGYISSTDGKTCVVAPVAPAKTNEQQCQDGYGINSFFLEVDKINNKITCDCKTGYAWNDARTGCVVIPVVSAQTNNHTCQMLYGTNSSWDGITNNVSTQNSPSGCNCNIGYQLNQSKAQCINISTKANDEVKYKYLNKDTWLAGPGDTLIVQVTKGTKVMFLSDNGDYTSDVKFGEYIGYIPNDFLIDAPSPTVKNTPIKTKEIKAITTTSTSTDSNINTSTTTPKVEVKPISFWSRFKGWFGF